MSEPNRHHYIPIFYLQRWIGEDKRLCEFSRPYKIVRPYRKHPSATGYEDGLYTIPGLPPQEAQFVEKSFMKATDDWASKALHTFLQPEPRARDLNTREHVGWARFVFSLMLRNPEQIARFREEAVKRQYDGPVEALLPEFINSVPVISQLVQQMTFHTMHIKGTRHALLTSDRPIIMTNGLTQDDAHLVMPISPRHLFIAVRNKATAERIAAIDPQILVGSANNKVAEQARKFVYGTDDSQLRFVSNRLGRMVSSTPLET
jgi:hypothetical protein